MEDTAILSHPPTDRVSEHSFLCARCRTVMSGRNCRCGFWVPIVDGIHDFISNDPACESLRHEIGLWDDTVADYDTCALKDGVVSVSTYFDGFGMHRSARHMLPALKELDLRGKVGIEVGGTGHSLAMMMRSGCTSLFHLEVSRETQRIARQNLAALPEFEVKSGPWRFSKGGTGADGNIASSYFLSTADYAGGNGNNTATWQTAGLATGVYDVQMTWLAYFNRASNATYQVFDGTTLVGTVSVNQRVAPAGGQTVSGTTFQSLGRFTINSGTLKVVLSDNANGYVNADAMLAAPI